MTLPAQARTSSSLSEEEKKREKIRKEKEMCVCHTKTGKFAKRNRNTRGAGCLPPCECANIKYNTRRNVIKKTQL